MYFIFVFFALIAPGADIRVFPSVCNYNWRVACSLTEMKTKLNQVNAFVTSEAKMEELALDPSEYTNGGFFPWISRRPDSTMGAGIETIHTYYGAANYDLSSRMRGHIELSLHAARETSCTELEMGDPDSPQVVAACSRNLTTTGKYYVTYMTKKNIIGSVLCDGSTNSACNSWIGANLLGSIEYAMLSETPEQVKSYFTAGVFDHGKFSSVLIASQANVWSVSNQSMPWFDSTTITNYASLDSFTLSVEPDAVQMKGWKVPLTMNGDQYQVGILFEDVAEPMFPLSNWASLDTSKSNCSPLVQTSECNPVAISSYILGNILQTANNASVSTQQLASKFAASEFNFGQWTPELRNLNDGSVKARGTLGMVGDVALSEEVFWVMKEALSTNGQSYVEYTAPQGPIRTYVVPIGDSHFATVSYVDVTLTTSTTSTSQQPETTWLSSSSSLALFAFISVALVW